MLNPPVSQNPVEIEGIAVERLSDIGFGIEAEDVQGERSQQGKDAGVAANTAAVFSQGFIADPVQAVLDVPVASDGIAPFDAIVGQVAQVQGGFVAGAPFRRLGFEAFDVAFDLDKRVKSPVPGLAAESSWEWPDLHGAPLDAVTPPDIVAPLGVNRRLESLLPGVRLQRGLVALQLHQKMVATSEYGLNRFFGHEVRPA